MLDQYEQRFGNVVNTDNMKLLLPGYDPHSEKSVVETHRIAGSLTGKLFNRMLAKIKKGDTVIFTGGGNGSGKSSVLSQSPDAAFVMDSTMANADITRKGVQDVLDRGGKVVLAFAYRNPHDAWFNGVQKRNRSADGHIVPQKTFANTHSTAKQNFIQLAEEFGNKVELRIRDNDTGGVISLDELKQKPNYTKEQIQEVINGVRYGEIRQGVSAENQSDNGGRSSRETTTGNTEVSGTQAGAVEDAGRVSGEAGRGLSEKGIIPGEDKTNKTDKTDLHDHGMRADESGLRPMDSGKQYSLKRPPQSVEDYRKMPAHPRPEKAKFHSVKELYDIYKGEYLGQTIRTISGHDLTFNPGHFFRLIAGTSKEGTKGWIAKAKNANEAIRMIEAGEIDFADIAGYEKMRGENISLFKDVVSDGDFYYEESGNKIVFGKKYDKIKKADGFLAVTLEIANGELRPVSFHPRNFTGVLLRDKDIKWNITNSLDHVKASGDISSRGKSSELNNTISQPDEKSRGNDKSFSLKRKANPVVSDDDFAAEVQRDSQKTTEPAMSPVLQLFPAVHSTAGLDLLPVLLWQIQREADYSSV